jgi:hypothetical protein
MNTPNLRGRHPLGKPRSNEILKCFIKTQEWIGLIWIRIEKRCGLF